MNESAARVSPRGSGRRSSAVRRAGVLLSVLLIGVLTAALLDTRRTHPTRASMPPTASYPQAMAVPVALGWSTPHLVVVMMENKEFTQVVGNAAAPYLNGTLIPSGKLFTAHYASTHPSLPNYLVLTSGQYGGCVSDGCPVRSIAGANLFSEMNQALIKWKVYAETMPANCYTANSGGYLVRHNPPAYYTNLQNTSGDNSCAANDVPLTTLSTDLQQGALPAFAMVVPNQWNDMHTDQKLAPCLLDTALNDEACQGDNWLRSWIPAILSDGGRNDTTVLITFDEGTTSQGGAGRVMLLEMGPTTCSGCTDAQPSTHYGLSTAITQWFHLAPLYPRAPEITSSPSPTTTPTV